MAVFNTNTAASTGAIGWGLVDYLKDGRKFSLTGVCEGIIAGLVGMTPAAGYVSVWCAAAIGFITSIIISLLQNINDWIGVDEGMDVFQLTEWERSSEAFSPVPLPQHLSRLSTVRLSILAASTVTTSKLGSNSPTSRASHPMPLRSR